MLPKDIIAAIVPFMPMFFEKTWMKVQILLIGAILCRGKRTITAILRVMGLGEEENFCNYHRILNRVKWSALMGSQILLGQLICIIPEVWPLIIGIDETIERRKGKKIKARGVYRDGVRSTKKVVVKCYGLKWISMMLILPLPWSSKCWALPFLTVLAPSERANEKAGKRHKTTLDWAIQMMNQLRKWIKEREIFLVGDGGYACVKFAHSCIKQNVKLVSRLRLDSSLYDGPPPEDPHKRGRKAAKGKKLPQLKSLVGDRNQRWRKGSLVWYGQEIKTVDYLFGNCLWYRPGQPPVPIRWVLISDPEGKSKTEAFFTTDQKLEPLRIVQLFIWRWNVETTFQECRSHLGLETQRQWSDKAIERTTPVILALFSITCLMALRLYRKNKIFPQASAWYDKKEVTFSDVLTFVRRHIWNKIYLKKSYSEADFINFSLKHWDSLIEQLALAA